MYGDKVIDNSGHSPIKEIRVKNFNCIDDVAISMEESPIVCLVGNNDCGKTSCLDSINYTIYHSNPRSQKDNIRDGMKGWGVIVELADGTSVVRQKTLKKNIYQVVYPDGTEWITDKIDSGTGAPDKVQEVFQCIQENENKQCLNIRTYRDLLMFVTTSTGANYKLFYGALKAEQISGAIRKGTSELNDIRSERERNEVVLKTHKDSLDDIVIHDIEPVVNIQQRVEKNRVLMAELEKAIETKRKLNKAKEELGKFKELVESGIESVDLELISSAVDCYNSKLELDNKKKDMEYLDGIEDLIVVDMSIVDSIGDAIEQSKQVKESKLELESLYGIESYQVIDLSLIDTLCVALNKRKELKENKKDYIALKCVEELKDISLSSLDIVVEQIEAKKAIDEDKKALKVYDGIEELESISIGDIVQMGDVVDKKRQLNVTKSNLDKANLLHSELHKELDALDIKTVECTGCGELVFLE